MLFRSQSCEVSKSFGELLQSLEDDDRPIAPHKFKQVVGAHSIQFSGTEQSDAHEFLTFLIDTLHEELKATGELIISDIFYGTFRSTIQCLNCSHQSISKEPFMCLSLPIETSSGNISITIYTRSNHLFLVNFKYEDDEITMKTMRESIQNKLAFSMLSFFIMIDNTEEIGRAHV